MCRFAQVRHARVGSIVTHSERAYRRRARMFASLVKGEAGDGHNHRLSMWEEGGTGHLTLTVLLPSTASSLPGAGVMCGRKTGGARERWRDYFSVAVYICWSLGRKCEPRRMT